MTRRHEKMVLDEGGISDVLHTLAAQVAESERSGNPMLLVGIHTRGIPLAERLARLLKKELGHIGTLDINLYRDDLSKVADMPVVRETKIPFDINDSTVLLVDDVLFTGRTVRAALDALMDLGRPKRIALLALIDRGGRELPIQPDFCGKKLSVASDEIVKVMFKETDDEDKAVIVRKE